MIAQVSTRSDLRQAALGHRPRKRRYLLRLALVMVVIGLAALLGAAVATRYFPTTGLFWPVYWLHDHLYLPLKGRIWTALFPYALVWLVPLAVVVLIVLAEFLLPFSPTAASHRWVLRGLAAHSGGRQLLMLLPRRYTYLVVDELQSESWAACSLAPDLQKFGDQRAITRLAMHTALRWQLSPKTPADLLQVFEITAFLQIMPQGKQAYSAHLQTIVALLAPKSPLAGHFARLLAENPQHVAEAEALELVAWLESAVGADTIDAPPDLALAALAIRMGLLGLQRNLPTVGIFFGAWARAIGRAQSGDIAARLERAQASIAFEFWAQTADHAISDRSDLLAQQLGHPRTRFDRGEAFAWGGLG